MEIIDRPTVKLNTKEVSIIKSIKAVRDLLEGDNEIFNCHNIPHCKDCPFNDLKSDYLPCLLGRLSETINDIELVLERYS